MKAVRNGTVVAESDDTVMFDGVYYFSEQSINTSTITVSSRVFHCPKRGYGVYCYLSSSGKEKVNAAVYFAHPYPEARAITGRLCFLYGVEIME